MPFWFYIVSVFDNHANEKVLVGQQCCQDKRQQNSYQVEKEIVVRYENGMRVSELL